LLGPQARTPYVELGTPTSKITKTCKSSGTEAQIAEKNWKENFFARAARPARAARAAHRLQHCSILRQEAPMSSSAHQFQKFQKLAKLRGRTRELLKKVWKEKYFRQVGFFWPAAVTSPCIPMANAKY